MERVDVCVGPGKWKKPHSTYRDLARAVGDVWMSMMFFVATAPLIAGALFFYVAYPALGIAALHDNNNNWTEPGRLIFFL